MNVYLPSVYQFLFGMYAEPVGLDPQKEKEGHSGVNLRSLSEC